MTTTTTVAGAPASSTPFQTVDHRTVTDVSRQEIQVAIAKAMELRSLHAALLQSNSPSHLRLPATSPLRRHVPQHSAQDYPVFTPALKEVKPLKHVHGTNETHHIRHLYCL
ncbi:hypothetical protein E3N88_16445 [Mikania micrantha]|uniref:Uncharacterized protein n=1 Tax=Mikania micrantha TaxID=192012 RepID=A0A5N6P1I6_9ASTR|nr:hypothetical protein E3N88_16445 [Mikania micrantha]